MQVSVESPTTLERRLTVVVEENKIDQAVQAKLKNLSKSVSLKGFRAGKVPMNVVKQRYGVQVRQEVLQDVIQSTFYEAITQEKLKPAGMPSFEPKNSEPGNGLEYVATFEVYPEISLGDFTKAEIEKPVVEIGDEDIDQMLDTIRKQHITWSDVERAAESGDKVTVDFVGTIDGEVFEGGSGTGMEVEIGKGQLIAGFEDGLIGTKKEEEKTLDLTFPDPYQNKDLAGKSVQFAVTVKGIAEPVLPEVNDDFAKKLNIDGGVDKLREEIQANMQRELTQAVNNQTKTAVMDALLSLHDIEIPSSLVKAEAQNLAQQMVSNMQRQGMPEQSLSADIFEAEAQRRVSLGLIMSEVVKQQNFRADEALLKQKLEEIAEPYEEKEQVLQWYYSDKQRLAEVESLVIEQQVVDWILEQAKISDKSMTFNEIMYPNNPK